MIKIKELYSKTDINDGVFNNIFGFYCEGHVDKRQFIKTIVDEYDPYLDSSNATQETIDKWIDTGWKVISVDDVKHKYCKWFKDDESETDSPYLLLESDTPRKDCTPMTILYLG